jgi:hypothetical protein
MSSIYFWREQNGNETITIKRAAEGDSMEETSSSSPSMKDEKNGKRRHSVITKCHFGISIVANFQDTGKSHGADRRHKPTSQ